MWFLQSILFREKSCSPFPETSRSIYRATLLIVVTLYSSELPTNNLCNLASWLCVMCDCGRELPAGFRTQSYYMLYKSCHVMSSMLFKHLQDTQALTRICVLDFSRKTVIWPSSIKVSVLQNWIFHAKLIEDVDAELELQNFPRVHQRFVLKTCFTWKRTIYSQMCTSCCNGRSVDWPSPAHVVLQWNATLSSLVIKNSKTLERYGWTSPTES